MASIAILREGGGSFHTGDPLFDLEPVYDLIVDDHMADDDGLARVAGGELALSDFLPNDWHG